MEDAAFQAPRQHGVITAIRSMTILFDVLLIINSIAMFFTGISGPPIVVNLYFLLVAFLMLAADCYRFQWITLHVQFLVTLFGRGLVHLLIAFLLVTIKSYKLPLIPSFLQFLAFVSGGLLMVAGVAQNAIKYPESVYPLNAQLGVRFVDFDEPVNKPIIDEGGLPV